MPAPHLSEDETRAIRVALDRFVSDLDGTGDLERLEDSFREFNLFEALGAVDAEIRHSNLLAWLLNPNASHTFGDAIVKRLFQRVLIQNPTGHSISAVDIDVMDLFDFEVRREWADINIFAVSPSNRLVVLIENKIKSAEGKNQLQRYRDRVISDFPHSIGWRHLFIYLTIDGSTPSDELYVAVSYSEVVQLLESTIKNRGDAVPPEIASLITHYTTMMRRHHMEDSELIQLARKIYVRHKPALDFIFDHRPDSWSDTRERVLALLSRESEIVIDKSTPKTINLHFYPKSWNQWAQQLSQGTGWKGGGSNQFLLCQLIPSTERDRCRFQVVLGPGPHEIRERIMSKLHEFGVYKPKHTPHWTTVYSKAWRALEEGQEKKTDPEKSAIDLKKDIDEFLSAESIKIEKALAAAFKQS